jgi:hypothetical protein
MSRIPPLPDHVAKALLKYNEVLASLGPHLSYKETLQRFAAATKEFKKEVATQLHCQASKYAVSPPSPADLRRGKRLLRRVRGPSR